MPLYWLCYRLNNQISVAIEPSASLIHARMRAELDRKWRVPKEMIGRRLSLRQAKKSLAKFERVTHRPLAADPRAARGYGPDSAKSTSATATVRLSRCADRSDDRPKRCLGLRKTTGSW